MLLIYVMNLVRTNNSNFSYMNNSEDEQYEKVIKQHI